MKLGLYILPPETISMVTFLPVISNAQTAVKEEYKISSNSFQLQRKSNMDLIGTIENSTSSAIGRVWGNEL
jgi:hypothetical protein